MPVYQVNRCHEQPISRRETQYQLTDKFELLPQKLKERRKTVGVFHQWIIFVGTFFTKQS